MNPTYSASTQWVLWGSEKPVSTQDLVRSLRRGEIDPRTLVRGNLESDWGPLSSRVPITIYSLPRWWRTIMPRCVLGARSNEQIAHAYLFALIAVFVAGIVVFSSFPYVRHPALAFSVFVGLQVVLFVVAWLGLRWVKTRIPVTPWRRSSMIMFGLYFVSILLSFVFADIQTWQNSWPLLFGEPMVAVSEDGRTLRIDGPISSGFTAMVEETLEAHPSIQGVDIDSPGGWSYQGRAAARLIEARQLDVSVHGSCDSTCTGLFMAGKHRYMAVGSTLGLHRVSTMLDSSLVQLFRRYAPSVLFPDEGLDAYLERHGMPPEFLSLMRATPPDKITLVSAERVARAGLATMVDGHGRAITTAQGEWLRVRQSVARRDVAGRSQDRLLGSIERLSPALVEAYADALFEGYDSVNPQLATRTMAAASLDAVQAVIATAPVDVIDAALGAVDEVARHLAETQGVEHCADFLSGRGLRDPQEIPTDLRAQLYSSIADVIDYPHPAVVASSIVRRSHRDLKGATPDASEAEAVCTRGRQLIAEMRARPDAELRGRLMQVLTAPGP